MPSSERRLAVILLTALGLAVLLIAALVAVVALVASIMVAVLWALNG